MRRYFGFVMLFLVFVTCSCSKTPPVQVEPKVTYTEKFIKIHLKADPQLNLYRGTSQPLHLCIYQLIDPNAFNQLSENEAGLVKLMDCERADGIPTVSGVAISNRVIMHPGEEKVLDFDRAEGAKYVGIVAGYYILQKKQAVRLYPIPVTEEKKGGAIIMKQNPLNVRLYLGPQALQDVGGSSTQRASRRPWKILCPLILGPKQGRRISPKRSSFLRQRVANLPLLFWEEVACSSQSAAWSPPGQPNKGSSRCRNRLERNPPRRIF